MRITPDIKVTIERRDKTLLTHVSTMRNRRVLGVLITTTYHNRKG